MGGRGEVGLGCGLFHLPLKSGCCLCLTFTASAAAFSDSDSEFRPIIAVAAAEFASAAHKLAAAARSPVAAVNPAAAAINYVRCCVAMDAPEDGRRNEWDTHLASKSSFSLA